jgi:hypothetical protein
LLQDLSHAIDDRRERARAAADEAEESTAAADSDQPDTFRKG